jgi:alpha-galactosidase
MEYQLSQPETKPLFSHFQKAGQWTERDDVWIKFLDRKGPLTVGYGSPDRIGPELQFGWTMGETFDEPVLIIKTAWGGKSLFRDFRPPSSGLPDDATLQQLLENARKRKPQTTLEEIKESFGVYYREMLEEIDETLAHLKDHFPAYEEQGYELAGFVWFQGWNDMNNDQATAEYAENMANLIRDVRKDLKSPALPFVIGQFGVGGIQEEPNAKHVRFKEAQAASAELPEFAGNVAVVKTDQFCDREADAVFQKGWKEHVEEWEKVGSDYPYHYLGSAKFHVRAGNSFAEAILKLQPNDQ